MRIKMSAKKNIPKRAYNSTRRQAQARQTRLDILASARVLFIERGYNGATIETIAQSAGVAPETVYAIFGNKKEILSTVVDFSLLGDDEPIPLLQRPGPQRVVQQTDPHLQIRYFTQDIRQFMTRVAPLFEVMNAAAKTEEDIAALRDQMLKERLVGMKFFIDALSRHTPLRQGVKPSEAAETVWALTSAEMFTLLTQSRGWSGDQYQRWLEDALARLLLD
jgi:TetR/AcrR family transcriptional regulator, regulator of autoinduction and epiphytic fitness